MSFSNHQNLINNKNSEDIIYWHFFGQIHEIGPARFQKLLNYFKSAQNIFKASGKELEPTGLEPSVINILCQAKEKISPEVEWLKLQKSGFQIITISDQKFPSLLREIYPPPFLLYYQGNINLLNETCLAVVGTRKITSYGQQVVPKIIKPLIESGVTIVSGLALGVDALAHQVCLENNGQTIAVLGSGLDQIYPPKNQCLAQKIIKEGLIISEYPPGTPPLKHHFPYRNRLISGLSLGTLVIEGAKDSGSLITTKYALDQNREIFAVPGDIFKNSSRGTNYLIQLGAKLVTSADDILESLNIKQMKKFHEARQIIPDNEEEKIILEILSHEPKHINEITKIIPLNIQTINSTLSIMEIKGKIKNLGGNNYVINS